jgi:hypothetical protein
MLINLVSERNDGQKERIARKGSQNRPSLKLASQVSLITGRNVKIHVLDLVVEYEESFWRSSVDTASPISVCA